MVCARGVEPRPFRTGLSSRRVCRFAKRTWRTTRVLTPVLPLKRRGHHLNACGPLENPGGFEPLADGLKGRSLSIRVERSGSAGAPFGRAHVALRYLVCQSGIEPASAGYRPAALGPLSYRHVKDRGAAIAGLPLAGNCGGENSRRHLPELVRPPGADPGASAMSKRRSADELRARCPSAARKTADGVTPPHPFSSA